jgi:hypothetical protein
MTTTRPTRILILGAGQGETPIRRLGPGDCFGEIALLGDHVRTASTHSVTSANVLAIDRDACQALLSTLPPLRDFFNRLLEERVGMRPESRNALDVSNDVITMSAESLKGQIALVTGATGGTKARGGSVKSGGGQVPRQLLPERHTRPMEPRLDRGDGLAEDPGRLLVGELFDITQDEHSPIGLGQLVDGSGEDSAGLSFEQLRLRSA